jgi:hypothetical protein
MTDFANPNCRIECRSLSYRSGVIEVGVIAPSQIDLEIFNFDPEKLPAGVDIRNGEVEEEALENAVYANTEIVLTETEAERLIDLLRAAIAEAKLRRQSGAVIEAGA